MPPHARRSTRATGTRSRRGARTSLVLVGLAAAASAVAVAAIHWTVAQPPSPAPVTRTATTVGGTTIGKPTATVTIEVFSDFLCSHCAVFASTVEPMLIAEFVNPGVARLVYRHFPIVAPLSETAAQASECAAEQQRFWPYHDALFAQAARGALRSAGDLETAARETGLDAAIFERCLRSGNGRARVDADRADGQRRGVRGTPTSFVNGQMIVGAQPIETFRDAIRASRGR